MLNKTIRFFLENKLIALLLLLVLVAWGLATAPFDWKIDALPRDPVAVKQKPHTEDCQHNLTQNE